MFHIIHDVHSDGGALTASAGTVINYLVPARKRLKTVLEYVNYKTGSTAHTLTVLRDQTPRATAKITATAAAATGQAVVAFSSTAITRAGAAGTVAANDWVALESSDGSTQLYQVSSVSSLNVTMTANISPSVNKGARIWCFGAPADHSTVAAFPAAASTTTTITDGVNGIAGVISGNDEYEPLLVQSNNATTAGTINQVAAVYIKQSVA